MDIRSLWHEVIKAIKIPFNVFVFQNSRWFQTKKPETKMIIHQRKKSREDSSWAKISFELRRFRSRNFLSHSFTDSSFVYGWPKTVILPPKKKENSYEPRILESEGASSKLWMLIVPEGWLSNWYGLKLLCDVIETEEISEKNQFGIPNFLSGRILNFKIGMRF